MREIVMAANSHESDSKRPRQNDLRILCTDPLTQLLVVSRNRFGHVSVGRLTDCLVVGLEASKIERGEREDCVHEPRVSHRYIDHPSSAVFLDLGGWDTTRTYESEETF